MGWECVGSYKWHSFLISNGGDISSAWCGAKRHSHPWEIFTGLFHKYIEEIERFESAVEANWYFLLKAGCFCTSVKDIETYLIYFMVAFIGVKWVSYIQFY